MARLAAAGRRRRPGAAADHVRRRRRAAPDRVRGRLAARLRGLDAGARRQRGAASSSSSTSTARCSTSLLPGARAIGASRDGPQVVGRSSCAMLEFLEAGWHDPDEGIWEVRGGAPALHALQGDGVGRVRPRGAARRGVRPRRARSTAGGACARRDPRARCCDEGFDAERDTFTQAYGSQALDAALLMIPLVGFLPADDPRIVGTVDGDRARAAATTASCCATGRDDGRRRPAAGRGRVPALLVLARRQLRAAGPHRRGPGAVRAAAGLANDVGLLSEEYDPATERQLGNFPQAFTHLAFVQAAKLVTEGRPEQRPF